jgi:hypothetical protein
MVIGPSANILANPTQNPKLGIVSSFQGGRVTVRFVPSGDVISSVAVTVVILDSRKVYPLIMM